MNTEQVLIALVGAEICQRDISGTILESVKTEKNEALYTYSKKQDLAHIVGHVLSKYGVLGTDAYSQKLKQQSMQAFYRYVRMNSELQKICKALEKGQIPFIPLKGSVLRNYYPEPWMRTSCDIDILVKEEMLNAAIATLKEALGYSAGDKGDHDISLFSPNGVHLELHYDTIQERYAVNGCRKVLARIWEDAFPKQKGAYQYCMSDEMFYFYHIAHMAKHFEVGGCGIRPFLDIWILQHRVEHDKQKRNELLRKGGLLQFAQVAEKVSEAWFSGAEMEPLTKQMSDYILRAGIYGSNENRAALGQAKMGGRLRYIITRRVFMPYNFLKAEYPVLQKHKWLTPVFQIVRWCRQIFSGGVKRSMRELKANAQISAEEISSTADLLQQLGL